MANILEIYTAEQLYNMYRLKILADATGLTDFNAGSKIRSLLESNSEIVASISMDFKEALYRAIPIALYQGMGFTKKTAQAASGYIRPFRKPAFTLKYTGSGTSALLTINSTTISTSVTGAPGDAFSLSFSSYQKTSDLVTAIQALSNWSATLVKDVNSALLYQYTAEEIIGKTDYLADTEMDIMLSTAYAFLVPAGYSVSIDGIQMQVLADTIILAGESGIQCLAQASIAGIIGNISANAIDTLNGTGYINSSLSGIDGVINDSAFSGGIDAETDIQRQTRFAEAINSLDAGTRDGIVSALSAINGIRSVEMIKSYPWKGTNTIIIDTQTGTISADLLIEINKVLYGDPDDLINYPGKNAEGIDYIITTPTITAIDITIIAYRLSTTNVDLTEIQTDVQTAIEQYINTRKLGQDIILSEVVRVAKNSNFAVYDVLITSPASNIPISAYQLARTGAGTAGTITVITSIILSE